MISESPSADAYTIFDFCQSHGISRAYFYLLLREGRAPKTFKLGRRRLVSREAALAWRQRMEAESNA